MTPFSYYGLSFNPFDKCFAAGLNPSLCHMEYICLSTVSVLEFYRQLCGVPGLEARGGKAGMFQAVQEQYSCSQRVI